MLLQEDLSCLRGRRVVVAMSGGVDSSAAAARLVDAGAEVVGVFLHVWDYARAASRHGSCCATEDAYDARRVADHLGIPFYVLDMRDAFHRHVIDPFVHAYDAGETPNPCERCNRFVKFGALLRQAAQLQAEYVATGHYVQRRDDEAGVHLFRGADTTKDQSYFLATTNRAQAARLVFPVGHLEKAETRRLAAAAGLPTASKRESQDVCFIPDGDRIGFLRRAGATNGLRPGAIVDTAGRRLGEHAGIAHYTLGQRRGLGLDGGPWHVVGLSGERAEVVVAPAEKARIQALEVGSIAWIRRPRQEEEVVVKLRYRSPATACRLADTAGGVRVQLGAAQALTAPGQVVAFYAGDELLGGGIVTRLHGVSADLEKRVKLSI